MNEENKQEKTGIAKIAQVCYEHYLGIDYRREYGLLKEYKKAGNESIGIIDIIKNCVHHGYLIAGSAGEIITAGFAYQAIGQDNSMLYIIPAITGMASLCLRLSTAGEIIDLKNKTEMTYFHNVKNKPLLEEIAENANSISDSIFKLGENIKNGETQITITRND